MIIFELYYIVRHLRVSIYTSTHAHAHSDRSFHKWCRISYHVRLPRWTAGVAPQLTMFVWWVCVYWRRSSRIPTPGPLSGTMQRCACYSVLLICGFINLLNIDISSQTTDLFCGTSVNTVFRGVASQFVFWYC